MPSTEAFDALQDRLGYRFKDAALLERALTHRSLQSKGQASYERLEFLGDRVLGLVIADELMARFPTEPEGHLSRRLNALVRMETLAEIASTLDLGAALQIAKPEESGSENPSILSDALEAVIAAIYRDADISAAKCFILKHWGERFNQAAKPPRDPKSSLQEWTMARSLGLPDYQTLDRTGPDHAPCFTIRVEISTGQTAQGTGRTKRIAEQAAASQLLGQLNNHE